MTFDPNRYKGEIERLAKEKTGRTLKLNGDIKMAFWPSLGADVAGVTFSEKGSKRAVRRLRLGARLGEADAAAARRVHRRLGEALRAQGAHRQGQGRALQLLRPDGRRGEEARRGREEGPEAKGQPVVFDIASVSIERASIAYIDLAAGQEYALEDLKLKTGRIAQDAEGKLELAMVAKRKAPPLQVKLSADGKYQLDRRQAERRRHRQARRFDHQGQVHRRRALRVRREHRQAEPRPLSRGAGEAGPQASRSRNLRPKSRRPTPRSISRR